MIDRSANYVTFYGSGCSVVALQALYKQVGTLLPNGRARHTLRLCAMRAPTATESEEGTLVTVLLTVNALRPSPWIVQYYFTFFLHNTHYLNNVADHSESRAHPLRHLSRRWCPQTGLRQWYIPVFFPPLALCF